MMKTELGDSIVDKLCKTYDYLYLGNETIVKAFSRPSIALLNNQIYE